MAQILSGLYYSRDHEWLRVEGDIATLGITDYAQNALGDIVFADGEPVGSELSPGDTAGVVESVKAASDVYTPVSGTVTEINPTLENAPEQIGSDPYGCYLIKLRLSDPAELDELLDDKAYAAFCESL